MDIRQIRHFLAVVDTGSFTKAAESLLVAQPSLSQTIKGLERELGVTLFHRIGRRITLSEAGRELEGPARLVIRDLETAEAHVRGLRGLRSGRIQIAAMPTPSIEPLTSLLSTFTREHPQISFDLNGTFTVDETIEAVRGRAEIGIPMVAAPAGQRPSSRPAGGPAADARHRPLLAIIRHRGVHPGAPPALPSFHKYY